MYKQPQIYYLTSQKIKDKFYFEQMCLDMQNSYYWSDDWSQEFYIELSQAGFISTTYDTKEGLVLLAELQFDYAILDFKNLHISKKVKKLINEDGYKLSINSRSDEVLERISAQHKYNWLKEEYLLLLKNLFKNSEEKRNFKLISVELTSKDSNELVAGEVGYIIGKTYTSLSGFSSKERKHNSCGNLQLVLLAKYLENRGFSFWNLGHPHMEYKLHLGCEIYKRAEFLKRWEISSSQSILYLPLTHLT